MRSLLFILALTIPAYAQIPAVQPDHDLTMLQVEADLEFARRELDLFGVKTLARINDLELKIQKETNPLTHQKLISDIEWEYALLNGMRSKRFLSNRPRRVSGVSLPSNPAN